MASETLPAGEPLKREVGYFGLMFVSLGCIIGSGWLMGALNCAKLAGPAAIISWVLGGIMLSVVALVYAELGTTYPVAGGAGRYAAYSHGPVAGFFSGWSSFLATVFIPPIEVLAAIAYCNSVGSIKSHFNMLRPDGLLNQRGLVVAVVMMALFTAMNLAGAKFMSDSNSGLVIWKTAIPLLALGVIGFSSFHAHNFTAGGGFMPFGWNGVFSALTGGVVFALEGFEQAVQLAGEAKDPQKHMSKAILTAMGIGALLYTALEVIFIAGVDPSNIVHNWNEPLVAGDYGAYFTLAMAIGATWLAVVLIIDAVVSPAGTGIIYVGTSARLTYAMAAEKELPDAFRRTNRSKVPWLAIVFSMLVGCIAFGPFKSWSTMVNAITDSTAFMYSFAPIALAGLHVNDVGRGRPYRLPAPGVMLPVSFVFTNLIVYWGGFEATWKVELFLAIGAAYYLLQGFRYHTLTRDAVRGSVWILPWLLCHLVMGYLGNYGKTSHHIVANGPDILIVTAFALAFFYWAKASALPTDRARAAIAVDAEQLSHLDELALTDLPLAVGADAR